MKLELLDDELLDDLLELLVELLDDLLELLVELLEELTDELLEEVLEFAPLADDEETVEELPEGLVSLEFVEDPQPASNKEKQTATHKNNANVFFII